MVQRHWKRALKDKAGNIQYFFFIVKKSHEKTRTNKDLILLTRIVRVAKPDAL